MIINNNQLSKNDRKEEMMNETNEQILTKEKNITVKKAAEMMGKSEQFIRIGLRNNRLPFGTAVKLSTHWTYHISPQLFYEYIGLIKKEPKENKNAQSENNLSLAGTRCFALHI
jgi:hypothetical protein